MKKRIYIPDMLSSRGKLSILLLCDNHRSHANTVLDHISAFVNFSRHNIHLYNPRWVWGSLSLDLDEFDVVVIHYSLYILSDFYLSAHFKDKLRRFQGLKIQFIQDDYRLVYEFMDLMRSIGINVLFTLYPSEQIPKVWDEVRLPGVVKITTLAGYIPDSLLGINTPPIEARPIDIGYRGRTLPHWLGELGQEKVWIGQGVKDHAAQYRLTCDIAWSEEDRIYGEDWIKFISSCKATLGTESGASITDFDGSVEKKVEEYLGRHPTASFEEVQQEILRPYEGNVPIKVISPRMFEAIALRTALILFPGDYSGILKPWIHYIPLNKDFSNIDTVVRKVRDMRFLRDLTDRAYGDIVVKGQYSFQSFIKEFDELIAKYAKSPSGRKINFKPRYWLARSERSLSLFSAYACGKLVQLPLGKHQARLRLGGPHGEIIAALTLIFQTAPLRRIFTECIKNRRGLKNVRLKTLIKELFLLGLLEQAYSETLVVNQPFSVSVNFAPDQTSLMITSQKTAKSGLNSPSSINEAARSDGSFLWSSIYGALQQGHIKTMIWDHSAVGGEISYVKKPFGVCIIVGEHGIRRFSCVLTLAESSS